MANVDSLSVQQLTDALRALGVQDSAIQAMVSAGSGFKSTSSVLDTLKTGSAQHTKNIKNRVEAIAGEITGKTKPVGSDKVALKSVVGQGYNDLVGTEIGGVIEAMLRRGISPTKIRKAYQDSLQDASRKPGLGQGATNIDLNNFAQRLIGQGENATVVNSGLSFVTGNRAAPQPGTPSATPGATSSAPAAQAAAQPAAGGDPVQAALASGDVRALQTALNAAGANLKVDGIRGPKTNAALAAYQGDTGPASAPGTTLGSGGGGGGGTVVSPPSAAPAPPPLNETDLRNYVLSNYGYGSVLFDDPEMKKILTDAANQRLTPEEVRARVMGTSFWKRTTAAARSWQQLSDQDPAQAQRLVETKKLDLRLEASRLGFTIGEDRLNQIATDVNKLGLTEPEVKALVAHEMHYNPGGPVQGDIGASMTQVKSLARDFFVDLSDQKAFEFAQKLYTGEMDDQGMRQFFANQAKSRFAANDQLVKLIDSGISPGQYFDSTKQTIANTLEINPDDIDFIHDPKWMRVIDTVDQKGNRRPMTIGEAADFARSQPEWLQTKQANQQTAALTNKVLQTFGVVG